MREYIRKTKIIVPILIMLVSFFSQELLSSNHIKERYLIQEREVANLEYLKNLDIEFNDQENNINRKVNSYKLSPDFKKLAYLGFQYKHKDSIITKIISVLNDIVFFIDFEPAKKYYVSVNGEKGKLYDQIFYQDFVFSPDGRHFAYPAQNKGEKLYIIYDGKELAGYDGYKYGSLSFSPDSNRFAYVTNTKDKVNVIINGKIEFVDTEAASIGILFSPNSKHYLAFVYNGKKWRAVVDGKAGKEYDSVQIIPQAIFSPNSQHIAYIASINKRNKKKSFLVLDGKNYQNYQGVTGLTFSPDSQRYLYIVLKGDNLMGVKLNGKEIGVFKNIYDKSLLFSSNSKNYMFSYAAKDGDYVNINGVNFGPYYGCGGGDFSPDGNRYTYVIFDKQKNAYMVLDGKVSEPYQEISQNYTFSPDGSRFAYSVTQDGKKHIIIDGKKSPSYYAIGVNTLTFSSDSKHFAYVAVSKEGYSMEVIDGKVRKIYTKYLLNDSFIFSPDSQKYAYAAGSEDKHYFILTGKEYDAYDGVIYKSLKFSPDSKHYVYAVRDGDQEFVVFDGNEGKRYDEIGLYSVHKDLQDKPVIYFDGNNRFYYYAIQDGKIYFVEEEIKPGVKVIRGDDY